MSRFDALKIGLVWQRLAGFIDEAAEVFVRTSFSSVVRDNWDMAVGLMDSQGRQKAVVVPKRLKLKNGRGDRIRILTPLCVAEIR